MRAKGGILIVFAIMLNVCACTSTRRAETAGGVNQKDKEMDCPGIEIAQGSPRVSWTAHYIKPGSSALLPERFSAYALDSLQLYAFFNSAANDTAEIVIPLSWPVNECKVFRMYNSGTMTKDMQGRYPQVISLKGTERSTRLGDARLDYNGKVMQGQIIWNDKMFFVKPVTHKGEIRYILFEKSDTAEAKKDFELNKQQQQPQNNQQNGLIELKYDR